jgi:hypothetical protein
MSTKLLAVVAIALCPAIALSQGRDTTSKATGQQATSTGGAAQQDTTTTSTSTGAVASENRGGGDANVVGTPAWWSTHATADGKPLSAGASARPQRSDSTKKKP